MPISGYNTFIHSQQCGNLCASLLALYFKVCGKCITHLFVFKSDFIYVISLNLETSIKQKKNITTGQQKYAILRGLNALKYICPVSTS